MRLFISVELPDEVKESLIRLQEQIPSEDAKLKPVNDFHLTLKFLGEVPEDKVEPIKDLLGKISFEPFTISTGEIGVFPSESYIRVVWVGLVPEDKITELQKQVDRSLEGMFPREKDFKPHLTLARVKFIKEKEQFIEKLNKIEVPKKDMKVGGFKLMKSTLTGKGPVYEELAVF